jgi:5'-nucleotidase
MVNDPAGQPRPLIQGASYGRLISEIDLTIDRRTRDVVRRWTVAKNHVVTRDVPKDPATTRLIEKYQKLAAPIANREIGTTTGVLSNSQNAAASRPSVTSSPTHSSRRPRQPTRAGRRSRS